MHLATTTPARKTAPKVGGTATKNRAWGFFGDSVSRTWEIDPQVVEQHLGKTTTGATTASGVLHWPSRDPIEEDGGVNLYGFVGNNGVNAIDYLGWQEFALQIEGPGLVKSQGSTQAQTRVLAAFVTKLPGSWKPTTVSGGKQLSDPPNLADPKKKYEELYVIFATWNRRDMQNREPPRARPGLVLIGRGKDPRRKSLVLYQTFKVVIDENGKLNLTEAANNSWSAMTSSHLRAGDTRDSRGPVGVGSILTTKGHPTNSAPNKIDFSYMGLGGWTRKNQNFVYEGGGIPDPSENRPHPNPALGPQHFVTGPGWFWSDMEKTPEILDLGVIDNHRTNGARGTLPQAALSVKCTKK